MDIVKLFANSEGCTLRKYVIQVSIMRYFESYQMKDCETIHNSFTESRKQVMYIF